MRGAASQPPAPPAPVVRPPPPKPLLLFITNVKSAKTAWVEISVNDNVEMLKRYVSRKMQTPEGDIVLIYMGEELRNETKIKESKLKRVIEKVAERADPTAEESTIHLIDIKDTPSELREPAPPPAA
mmetsp:Transcript_78085/g.204996  ORF Transcript_78085/g.204996 Transcript_78085/m.204996 type:complete len:127 (+) Transcript_78085:48-428(+)